MCFDIVPVRNDYRGVGRSLQATDLYTRKARKLYDDLLDRYYEYLSVVGVEPTKERLCRLISLCEIFSQYGVRCEVIVYDTAPVESSFGYALDFLGIDIVHDMSESLLSDYIEVDIQRLLNKHGLCDSEPLVHSVIPLMDHGGVRWDPCYVYRVLA